MKLTFFRILATIAITVSLSATKIDARPSVCCPVFSCEAELIEDRCNDYLRENEDNNAESAEDWIDRVSDSLSKANPKSVAEAPLRAEPSSATPIEIDSFEAANIQSMSADAAQAVSEVADDEIVARKVTIMRAKTPITKTLVSTTGDWQFPVARNERMFGSAIWMNSGLAARATASKTSPKNSLASHYSMFESSVARFSEMSMHVHGMLSNISLPSIEKRVEVIAEVPAKSESNSVPAFSQYDVYDSRTEYLFGCLGYESFYGKQDFDVVGEARINFAPETVKPVIATNLSDPAQFDGYMPYDLDAYDVDETSIAESSSEVASEKTRAKATNVSFKKKQSREILSLPAKRPTFSFQQLRVIPALLHWHFSSIREDANEAE